MFRSLIFIIAIALVVWLVSRMFKNTLGKSRPNNDEQDTSPKAIKNIVQCVQCQAFVPEDKALKADGKTFCSQQHLDEWKDA